MTEDLIMQIITGPVAALGLCIMALWVIFKWIGQNVPQWVARHLAQIDSIVHSHDQDREMYRESLETLTIHLKDLDKEVTVIKEDVKDIKSHIRSQV